MNNTAWAVASKIANRLIGYKDTKKYVVSVQSLEGPLLAVAKSIHPRDNSVLETVLSGLMIFEQNLATI